MSLAASKPVPNINTAAVNVQNGNESKYGKWSGLGMGLFSTENTSEFDGYVDILLANGFTEISMSSGWNSWDTDTQILTDVISATAKGAHLIWGVQSGAVTLTSSNWTDYADAVLAAAQWAQDNGVYEFKIGNEEEYHNDDTTLTDAQVIANLKTLATAVQAIFTRGNVSYPCAHENIDDWITAGKGDLDILSSNIYRECGVHDPIPWQDAIDALFGAFGAGGTYVKEFSLHVDGLDHYSADEAVQTAAVTEMIEYIKASGMTRAIFFCYKDSSWLSGFGALKDDGTYRLLWNQALLNSGSVKSITVPLKTTAISLPNTIELMPK
jgi:hypothetical protein